VKGSQEGFTPYLLGHKGYSLIPWIMILHEGQQHSMLELCTIESINEGDWLLKMLLAF
jgi:hypothetical protein